MLSNYIESLLKKIAEKRLGPTHTSRWLFLFTQLVHDGYQFVSGGNRNLDLFTKSNSNYFDITAWMEPVCDYSYNKIIQNLGFSSDFKDYKISNNSFWNDWKNRANTYLSQRDEDGWKQANDIKGTIPNSGKYIETTTEGLPDDLSDYKSWTPLSISGQHKNYLTPEWGDVSGLINTEQFNYLLQQANKYLPKSESDWDKETKEVLSIYNNLTDKEKMIAEFWAGGPGSVTPPGFWFVFAYCICTSKNLSIHDEIKIYTLLGIGMFQASILAWKLKRLNLQARPIQRIRYLYPENKGWLPYQENNFVTPPFPDFVSGHSTFSATGSRILYKFLRSNSINLEGNTFSSEILTLLNPELFSSASDSKSSLCQINILPGKSSISTTETTPLSGCRLSWSTLDDMAEEAGRSRIYGGIHVETSNQAGLALGRELAEILCEKYSKIMDYKYSMPVPVIGGFKIYKNSSRI